MAERERWDAIVIGSGLGGLTCAAYLCAIGKRTLVLEAHYVAGGNSQAFRRNLRGRAYEFDVGVHYIGECGPGGLFTNVFNALGIGDRLKFRELDPDGFDTLSFPDFTFRVPAGWEEYERRLVEQFPRCDGKQDAVQVSRLHNDDEIASWIHSHVQDCPGEVAPAR